MEGNNNSLETPGPSGSGGGGFRGFRRAPHHWAFQMGLRTAQEMATAAPRRLREDFNHVIRGLSPLSLMEGGANNTTRMSWLLQDVNANRNVGATNRQQPAPQIISNRNDITINLDQPARLNPDMQPLPVHPILDNISIGNGARNNQEENPIPEAAEAVRNSPELQALVSLAEKYVPFLLILLLKIVFDHRIGILIIVGLFLTFCHANAVVKREVGKQAKRQFSSLAIVTVNLCTCIGFVYFVLAEDSLAYALILVPPYSSPITIWEVLWIVTVTDFVLKLITVLLKVIVTAVPGKVIPFKKKGKYFLFIETTFQLYRTISPMQHWLYYFSESYHGSSKVFGVILSAAYLVTKCKDIVRKTKIFRKAFNSLLQSVRAKLFLYWQNYGIQPNAEQLKTAGESCPICQDDYRTPTMLQCKHIFCEECVSIWFDRERTCPMCRAQIADDPTWRDGSTTFLMQIF